MRADGESANQPEVLGREFLGAGLSDNARYVGASFSDNITPHYRRRLSAVSSRRAMKQGGSFEVAYLLFGKSVE